jgi:Amt family ammonium transporter
MVLTLLGASLLWVGWFGFNPGSAVSAGLQAGMAVTHVATATAAFTWMLVDRSPRNLGGHEWRAAR